MNIKFIKKKKMVKFFILIGIIVLSATILLGVYHFKYDEIRVVMQGLSNPALAQKPSPAEQVKTNSVGMKLVWIPPGEFMMGSTAEEQARLLTKAKAAEHERIPSEGPQHRVTISKPFRLSSHEVTRGQFRQFVEETGYKTEAELHGKGGYGRVNGTWVQDPQFVWSADLGFEQTDEQPVVNVS